MPCLKKIKKSSEISDLDKNQFPMGNSPAPSNGTIYAVITKKCCLLIYLTCNYSFQFFLKNMVIYKPIFPSKYPKSIVKGVKCN